jgi:RHH-type proline utilization regulon transcriptional repressor/proline dehydrogenase/delta 1-pyrroline-5-carboxylate dehydrogenase
MTETAPLTGDVRDLARESVDLVERWLTAAAAVPEGRAADRLAGVLKDPGGLDFTVGFVDGVIRPEDPRIAAGNLAVLARDVPAFLPWHLRLGVRAGALAARVAPGLVIPVVRAVLRGMVGHLVVDARPRRLGRAIARIRRDGARLNVNLLGEAVLGQAEARRRLAGTQALLGRPDVDYVSIKVSSTVAPHSPWAFEQAVAEVVDRLTPLFEQAAAASPAKFINLDMEEYHDLELTIAVFTRILEQPALAGLEAGIVLQAYLPDALAAMIRLQEWAAARREAGGAGIKVRIVKGANLPMERVEASVHGWPLATWSSKQESDTNYKRVLSYAFDPARIGNVRIGVAGHNLFDVAFAWLLAGRRGVREGIEIEMLLGMAQGQAEVVRREVGGLRLYTPVVHPREFDVAIAYLVRRLEEGASQDNFMSAVFDLHADRHLFEREKQRFLTSLAELDDAVPAPHRVQDRLAPIPPSAPGPVEFANEPDTDPSLPANQRWGRAVLERAAHSRVGVDLVRDHTVTDADVLDKIVAVAVERGREWGALTGAERAVVLRRAAQNLRSRRGLLAEVMAAETGKTLDQADPEVSEAIDFAAYYAGSAELLDTVDGARFHPVTLTVVTPPWNFPLAIPAGSTLAALAAGSAVIVKPAPQAARTGSLMVEALWDAGVPREVLALAHLAEADLGSKLISDERVDQVVLTGAYETAQLFASIRPNLRLLAETSGKNAIVVTPSADLDLAARDVAQSAFGHAGQKCSAASLVILVGSAATSRRFHDQLVDAVSSLRVGPAGEATSQMGPLIEPAQGKLLAALTTLDPGETWVLRPERLDVEGRLWSPGIRAGVRRGSRTHLVEYFGPVLGVMTAESLEEAIAIQNDVDYGLTAGLHSLDEREIALWLDQVQAGNLYVNRGITGAVVRRQPFGGWKRSAVGSGFKAGGPNYLFGLGHWESRPATAPAVPLDGPALQLLAAAREYQTDQSDQTDQSALDALERAFRSDVQAWAAEFAAAADVSALLAERNIFRYRPAPTLVRLAPGAPLTALVRSVGAALRAGAEVSVSIARDLPPSLAATFEALGVPVLAAEQDPWQRGTAEHVTRIRLIGAEPLPPSIERRRVDVQVFDHDVTEAGRVELLCYLREQAVSVTAHRFGSPTDLTRTLI